MNHNQAAAALALDDITCTFVSRDDRSQRYTAVRNVTLHIAPGEFVSVVGPTGCGKSTLLNVGAGLLAPSSGSVSVFGAPLAGINARAGYMFQAEALMPWRTTLENVTAGLEFRGVPLAQARQQGEQWLKRVGLGGFGDRYPHSSPAACASAPRSRRRWCWTPTSFSWTSHFQRSTSRRVS